MARLFGDAYASVSDPFLRRALDLAERGRGATYPNPLVGCVLADAKGNVVGEGWHEMAGAPHAEAAALAAAGARARGATAYVTLEPCAHEGRTPPCAAALVAAGVARVVAGTPDPHPAGRGGAAILRAAGVAVEFASDATPFEELNRAWLTRVRLGRPRVRVKVALTLDGRPALRIGERCAISGLEAAAITARLRGESDAVMVGAATVASDDPALTVRDAAGAAAVRQPLRVVLCGSQWPNGASKVLSDGAARTVLLAPDSLEGTAPAGTEVVTFVSDGGLDAALRALGSMGVTDLLVEPGPRLFTALVDAGLVDDLVVYHAGSLAGASAPSLHVSESGERPDRLPGLFRAVETGVAGADVVTVWRRVAEAPSTKEEGR